MSARPPSQAPPEDFGSEGRRRGAQRPPDPPGHGDLGARPQRDLRPVIGLQRSAQGHIDAAGSDPAVQSTLKEDVVLTEPFGPLGRGAEAPPTIQRPRRAQAGLAPVRKACTEAAAGDVEIHPPDGRQPERLPQRADIGTVRRGGQRPSGLGPGLCEIAPALRGTGQPDAGIDIVRRGVQDRAEIRLGLGGPMQRQQGERGVQAGVNISGTSLQDAIQLL